MATTTTTKSPPAINALKSAIQLTDHHKNQSLRPGQNIHTGSQAASQPANQPAIPGNNVQQPQLQQSSE